MATLASIRTKVLGLVANSSQITASDATTLIQTDHDTIVSDHSWSRRKIETLLTLSATTSTGTISGASGSTTITGSGTSFASTHVNRYLRAGSNTYFHKITAVTNATTLTIEAALPAAIAASTSYTIFQHIYNLPSDFGRITNVTLDVRLREWPGSDIDRIDPYRSVTASKPYVYSMEGLSSATSGVFQIEFWPVPSAAQAVRIEYLKANSLSADTDEPLYRADILVWKSAESAAFFLYGRTGDQAWLGLADRYHERYKEALQGAIEDDLGKYAANSYVRDRLLDLGRGDDFYLSRDPSWFGR